MNSQSLIKRDIQLDFVIYGYVPSLAPGLIFTILFGLLMVIHFGLVAKYRNWFFLVLGVGGLAETLGWIGRLLSWNNVYSLNAFLLQQCLLVLAPTFFSAACYASLGLLIRLLGRQYSRLSPNLYLIVFITIDIIALIVQAVGGGMAATALSDGRESTTGTHIMVGGIVFQLAAMTVFCLLGAEFFIRARRDPAFVAKKQLPGRKINRFAFGIVFASAWILVRCIYRTIELLEGWTGYLITTEPYFWCLDALPMLFALAIFVPCHPAFCLPNEKLFGRRNTEETLVPETSEPKTTIKGEAAV